MKFIFIFIFLFCFNAFADISIIKVSNNKNRVKIKSTETLDIGSLLKATDEFGETCEIVVIKIFKGNTIGDSSKCEFKGALSPNQNLDLVNQNMDSLKAEVQYLQKETSKKSMSKEQGSTVQLQHGYIGYDTISFSGVSDNLTGWGVGGYLLPHENFLIGSSYGSGSLETIKVTSFLFSLRYVMLVKNNFNILFGTGFSRSSVTISSTTTEVNDTPILLGFIFQPNEDFKLSLNGTSVDGEISTSIGVEFFTSNSFSLGIGTTSGEGFNATSIALNFY